MIPVEVAERFKRESEVEMAAGGAEIVASIAHTALERGLLLDNLTRELINQTYRAGWADGGKFSLEFMDRHREA